LFCRITTLLLTALRYRPGTCAARTKRTGSRRAWSAPASSIDEGNVRGQPTLIDKPRNLLKICSAPLVVDPDRRDGSALLGRGLGADSCTRILGRHSPAFQALDALLDGRIHDDNRVKTIRVIPFNQPLPSRRLTRSSTGASTMTTASKRSA